MFIPKPHVPRHHGRHRQPAQTVVGLISETLGDRRRVGHVVRIAAVVFLGVAVILAVVLLCDPAIGTQLVGYAGRLLVVRLSRS
jgi:hypothetical protein